MRVSAVAGVIAGRFTITHKSLGSRMVTVAPSASSALAVAMPARLPPTMTTFAEMGLEKKLRGAFGIEMLMYAQRVVHRFPPQAFGAGV